MSQKIYNEANFIQQQLITIEEGIFNIESVTQLTSTSTAVTINSKVGIITTEAYNISGLDDVSFTVNNSEVSTGDVVLVNIISRPGIDLGMPCLNIDSITNGSFVIKLANARAANPLTGVYKYGFYVLKHS